MNMLRSLILKQILFRLTLNYIKNKCKNNQIKELPVIIAKIKNTLGTLTHTKLNNYGK